jgi:glutamyl/glutaminyl-tRNA synthetase
VTIAGVAGRTRFAPAPTGYLHLGHVANAIFVWGMARAGGGAVLLRIEDHDRQRARVEYEAAIVEDLDWLGFGPDRGPVRQTDDPMPYQAAHADLDRQGLVYACGCTRSTFARWADAHGAPWRGPGCPGGCRQHADAGATLRVALGGGSESWMDTLVGPCSDEVAAHGDAVIRDPDGNWSYLFSVVVDDLRQDIDLVIRGRDLLGSTAAQIRLGRILGRPSPATFAHHRLVRRADGHKLSKADGDTSVRDLRATGRTAPDLIGEAAVAVGLLDAPRPIEAAHLDGLFGPVDGLQSRSGHGG